ncbi:MAG: hypothetical protein K6A92_00440, partial [Lachnospiraceae bacterium]|nr:hypothetical protein [Lachnospiraceae bacterium]
MKDYLKTYPIRITALAPIYIGGGVSLSKKEYIYDAGLHKVLVPDTFRMVQGLQKKGILNRYMDFMQKSDIDGLDQFLGQCNIRQDDY